MSGVSKRGRRPKDESERLNARVWYYAVKAREGLSDQALSEKFVTDPLGQKREGADHIRVFGKIRRLGVKPSHRHPRRHYDLVARIDADPAYAGTAKIMNSPFWRLILKTEFQLEEIRDIIVDCIQVLELATQSEVELDDGRSYLEELVLYEPDMPISEYFELLKEGDRDYDEALGNMVMQLPLTLDLIALVGAFGLEAVHANNMQIASDHMKSFSNLLAEYCQQQWVKPIAEDLYSLARSRMEAALMQDILKGTPKYCERIKEKIPGANVNSRAVAFLRRHERLLWHR
jgi:hypothetical protein